MKDVDLIRLERMPAEIGGRQNPLLTRAGSDKTKILRAQIFIADLADFSAMNVVWEDWVAPGDAPPRATVQAHLVKPEWKIEVVVTAALP